MSVVRRCTPIVVLTALFGCESPSEPESSPVKASAQSMGAPLTAVFAANETFDADPGWTLFNNPANNNDFGFRDSDLAGGTAGEAGGFFSQTNVPVWYGDETIGAFGGDDELSASGILNIRSVDLAYNNNVFIGHFDNGAFGTGEQNGIGFQVLEGATQEGTSESRIFYQVGTNEGLLFTIDGLDLTRAWSYVYDPSAGSFGSLTVSVSGPGGETVTHFLSSDERSSIGTIETFGFAVKPSSSNGTGQAEIYFDNLTYDNSTGPTLTYSYEGNAFGSSVFGPAFQETSSIRGGVTLEFLGAGTYGGAGDFDTISDWSFGVTFTPSAPLGGFVIHDNTPELEQSSVLITLDAAGNVVGWDVTVRAPVPPGGPDLFITIKDGGEDAIANIGTPEVSSGSVQAAGSWGALVPDLNDPELPDGIVDCGPTCFDFRVEFSGNWFDPTPVTQYTYVVEPGTLFTGVELPPNFGDNFVLSALGCSFAPSYSSLTFIDLVALCGEAIPSFTVSGISPPADADDPLGFPTRLTFNNLIGSFSMVGSQPASCSAQSDIPEAECDALAALYHATDGGNWSDNSGWLVSTTPCSWFGISCSSGHVEAVDLTANGLSGSITSALATELANLTHLSPLLLSGNQLSGTIPAELGSLSSLEDLSLHENQLTGTIPPELGNLSNLGRLRLDDNQLAGPIPAELGDLPRLSVLRLNVNQLTGPIPPELGNLATLRHLSLRVNQLTGGIPPELGALEQLTFMSLDANELTGGIPPQLGNLSALEFLQLSINPLGGSIPAELGNLSNLQILRLRNNQLTGRIPAELGSLSNLENLWLSNISGQPYNNDLEGLVPPAIAGLGGALQADFGDGSCLLQANPALFMPDTQDYIDADLDTDGFICGIALTTPTPEQVVSQIEALAENGSLNGGQASSLMSKLDRIRDLVDQGKTKQATNLLRAFINQVTDFVATGVLSESEGQFLTDQAELMLEELT